MRVQDKLSAAALAVLLGGMIVPAFARNSGDTRRPADQGIQMEGPNHRDQGMTPDSGMARRCAGMMQSMNGGTGRPNSQWHAHPPGDGATPD